MYRSTTTDTGMGAGLFLIVVGAILTFAVETTVSGFDIDVAGIIMMTAGLAAFIWALIAIIAESGPSTTVTRYERTDSLLDDEFVDDRPIDLRERRVTRRRHLV